MTKSFIEEKKLQLIYITILVCLISSMLLSIKLWMGQRYFPLIPVLDFLPQLKYPYDSVLFYFAEIIFALNVIYFFDRRLHFGLIFSLIILAIFDISRIQPWYFNSFLLIIPFYFLKNQVENKNVLVNVLLKLIISIYLIWNGLNKINISYFKEVIPWFTQAFPKNLSVFIFLMSILLPILEIIAPIILWREKTRKIGIILVLTIQFFYIAVTSPLGHNINLSMIPWHLSISLITFLLFQKNHAFQESLKLIIVDLKLRMLIMLIALLPLLNLFNLWDAYLSFNVYSNAGARGTIYLGEKTLKFLPTGIEKNLKNENKPNIIDIKKWAINDLGAGIYPEKRAFKKVKSYFMKYSTDSSDVILNLQEKQTIFKTPESIIE